MSCLIGWFVIWPRKSRLYAAEMRELNLRAIGRLWERGKEPPATVELPFVLRD